MKLSYNYIFSLINIKEKLNYLQKYIHKFLRPNYITEDPNFLYEKHSDLKSNICIHYNYYMYMGCVCLLSIQNSVFDEIDGN